MKLVFLDSHALTQKLDVPSWISEWVNAELAPNDSIKEIAQGAQIIITNKVKITQDDLKHLPELKLICVSASGYDHVDIQACQAQGITVSNVAEYSTQSVAESVIGSIFVLRRQMLHYRELAREKWHQSDHFCVYGKPILDLDQSVVGIIGRGAIGNKVAELAQGLGMSVIFAERKGAATVREGYVSFEECLKTADIVSLHCPANAQNVDMIGKAELDLMKPTGILINTARGQLVDAKALIDALDNERIAGAALDVLKQEPPQADDICLTHKRDNLLVTPHIAWTSKQSRANMYRILAENIEAFHQGKPQNVVS